MDTVTRPKLLNVLSGIRQDPVPVWMMRQAGRHLPEYLELRSQARDFLNFCYSPALAAEATMQPIERYDMDGAILFADILLVLDALGLNVKFEKGVGPIVETVSAGKPLQTANAEKAAQRLSPVFETVTRVRGRLSADKTLIGFCGSPWTVALYAIEGRGGTDKSSARIWAYQHPEALQQLLDTIIDISAHYLAGQVSAGADALMLFESWAEGLPETVFKDLVIDPNQKLIRKVRALGVTVPIIGFPRGAGTVLPHFVNDVEVNAVGLDTAISTAFVNKHIPKTIAVQGHLDPLLIVAGGHEMDRRVNEILDAYAERPHIFNLGHGIRPETPIANVERVVELIRARDA
ncbi:MAG: uroporphyrinogen decarboxylase [Pseudomonadota bacterium]